MKEVLKNGLKRTMTDIVYMEMKRYKKKCDGNGVFITLNVETEEYYYNQKLNLCTGSVEFLCEISEVDESIANKKYGEINVTYNVGLQFDSDLDINNFEDKVISELIIDVVEKEAFELVNEFLEKMELPNVNFSSGKRG